MAGSIIINKQSVHDLRTIDFMWLAEELRSEKGKAAAVLAKVLWPLDEGGMDMLQADDLDEVEFKLFAQTVRNICNSSASTDIDSGMSQFLVLLLQDIEEDARYL
ncbi:hypothetical protein IB234_20720 [Pseudomonas sp. PDM16]|uniref:hypothetical protein n=1 Tax=Pseudomonas sp. PDM16 TaxID=2769292 RepID=UPI001782D700|nr:hypothetical protein [Pseudomonas sp. PDM16]MBD9416996.1 hypothetical protein [Pseudomonas sp. PDM16]